MSWLTREGNVDQSSPVSLLFRSPHKAIAMPLMLLLLFLTLFAPSTRATIWGVTSWSSMDESNSGDVGVNIPLYSVENGRVSLYLEVVPSIQVLRIRNLDGMIKSSRTFEELSSCIKPTGVFLFNEAPRAYIFCAERLFYLDVSIIDEGSDFRVEQVETTETFFSSTEPHPSPLVLVRGRSSEFRADVVFVASTRGREACVGMYGVRVREVLCQADPITDFYFSKWVPPTDDNLEPEISLIVEQTTESGITLSIYSIPTFSSDAAPTATQPFISMDISSKWVRTNVNDVVASSHLMGYVQSVKAETIKLMVYVIRVDTLEVVKSGAVNTGVVAEKASNVISAYMVAFGGSQMIVAQMPDIILAFNYNGLPEDETPIWVKEVQTSAGFLFAPLRNLDANAGEWHRLQLSPSFTDYNPYHVITAERFQTIGLLSNVSTHSLSDGSITSSYILPWGAMNICEANDRMVALTAFEANLAYLGCGVSGRYGLVDLSTGIAYYSIVWPSVSASLRSSLGYLSKPGRVSLTNQGKTMGVDLHPLPLYSTPVVVVAQQSPVRAYYRGRVAMVTSNLTASKNVLFSLYVFNPEVEGNGRYPVLPVLPPISLDKEVESGKSFVAFFGSGKRYIAVSTTPGIISVFHASSGARLSDLNLTTCILDEDKEMASLSFMESIQHHGSQREYHVVVGGSSSCIFEVNDTLVPRVTRFQSAESGAIYGTTSNSAYKYVASTKSLQAFSDFFGDTPRSVYTVPGIDAYVVGSNVFVYVKGKDIICRSVRSDIIVWTQQLPNEYQSPIVHMTYYNNTVFLVDQRTVYRYNVQYREDEDGSSRVLFKSSVDSGVTVKAAGVGKGIVVLYSISGLYAYDAVTGEKLWMKVPRTRTIPQGSEVEVIVYSPQDVGGEHSTTLGPAYIEVRISGKSENGNQIADLYSQDEGIGLTSATGTKNDLRGPVIWGKNYITFSSNMEGGIVSFRGLNLPDVPLTEQWKRQVDSTTDVFVPGEPPVIPPLPPLPRGDYLMAGAPPMVSLLTGEVSLISASRDRAIVGTVVKDGGNSRMDMKCVNVNDPNGEPIRAWVYLTAPALPPIHVLEYNSDAFIILTNTRLQFFSWSNCKEVGQPQVLSGLSSEIPSFFSRANENQWVFLSSERVTAIQFPSGNVLWQTVVGGCRTIRLAGDYVICDGGDEIIVLSAEKGEKKFMENAAGCIAMAGSNFGGVILRGEEYRAVWYSISGKVFENVIDLPVSAGDVMSALPGNSNTKIVVFFEHMAISVNFIPSSESVEVVWSSDLNGESPERGAAGYVAQGNANIVVGTANGIVVLDAGVGDGFASIFLPRRYTVIKNEVQVMSIKPVAGNELYGISWNGNVALVRCFPLGAEALFSFGSGRVRNAQFSVGGEMITVSAAGASGIVPVNTQYWGAPFSMSVLNSDKDGVFLAGWNQRDNSGVNLATMSANGQEANFLVPKEKSIVTSLPRGNDVLFLGSKTISVIGRKNESSKSAEIPSACVGATLNSFAPTSIADGYSIAWYSAPGRDCIITVGQRVLSPFLLDNFKVKYTAMANLPYGSSFGLLTARDLLSISYNGVILGSQSVVGATYFSSISSPDPGQGIFVVISAGNRVTCYQVKGLLPVWSYTLSAISSAPVTYFNNSIFVSTEKGPYLLSLLELSYPCPDRAILHVSREKGSGRSTVHTQVVVNAKYGIAYVTTYEVFYAFDTVTGKVLWERPDLYAVKQVAVLRNSLLLAVCAEKSVVFLNPFTGKSLLFFPNVGDGNTEIFLHPDEKIVAFGGTMSTVIDITDYSRFFNGVEANRPELPPMPQYKAYNYEPSDNPNDCRVPDNNTVPIVPTFGEVWVSGASYGSEIKSGQTDVVIAHGAKSGWGVSWKGNEVYVSSTMKGTFLQTKTFTITSKCSKMQLYPVSEGKLIIGLTCGSEAQYYSESGKSLGKGTQVAKDNFGVVLKDNGYFINPKNYVDAVSLSNFNKLPGSSATVQCKGSYDILPLPKAARIILICANVGIVSINPTKLGKVGNTVTAGSSKVALKSYDMDDALGVGIACGKDGSQIHMVAFLISSMTVIIKYNETSSSEPLCGIRHPGKTKLSEPVFVLATTNGFITWDIKGGEPKETQKISDSVPVAISSEGLLYLDGRYDFYFRAFGSSSSTVVIESQGPSTGHMLIRDSDGVKITSSVIVYGESFSFAVDTSKASPKPFWAGTGNTQFGVGNRYISRSPFVYTTMKDKTLYGLMASNVSYGLQGIFRMQTALVDKQPHVFLSQTGTIGSLGTDGTVFWNTGFGNPFGLQVIFDPVVLDASDYVLASGGGRLVSIVNKRTGVIASNVQLDICRISPTPINSKLLVNGTFVILAIEGWSCVHILSLQVVNASGKVTVPPVRTLEVEGIPTGITQGFPIWANAGQGDHLLFSSGTPDTNGRNQTFAVYRVNDLKSGSWTRLWVASIRVDPGTTSTYGYFFYTAVDASLNVYDLFTGRYVWGYIFDGAVLGPAIGVDRVIHVVTEIGLYSLRANLDIPWAERKISFLSATIQTISAASKRITGPIRTPYGQIIFAHKVTAAFQHERNSGELSPAWSSEKRFSRLSFSHLSEDKPFGLFDSESGTGSIDLTNGLMMWLSNMYPSVGVTNGVMSGSKTFFICSFVVESPNCRHVPVELLEPSKKLAIYQYEPEPIETTPDTWDPIFPGGGGNKPLKPSPRCDALMRSLVPPFSNCVQYALDSIYPNGWSDKLSCPFDFYEVSKCKYMLQGLADACIDVAAYISEHWNRQTVDKDLPLGVCNSLEAALRCGTNNTDMLKQSCAYVTMDFALNNYENTIGYNLGYSLPVFQFITPPTVVNAGAVAGGVIGAVVVLGIIAAVVIYFNKRRKKIRDSRFFDDDIESNLLSKDDGDEKMVELCKGHAVPSSKESSVNLTTVKPRALPPGGESQANYALKDAAASMGPKIPPMSLTTGKPLRERVIDVDDI